MLSVNEQMMMNEIERGLAQMRAYFLAKEFPSHEDISAWYTYLGGLKAIQGNINNDVSFLSTLLAKRYLHEKYGVENFDAAAKPQGAPGIDINVKLLDGRRLVAEIKATSPYKTNDLGAKQKEEFEKDFTKLKNAIADIKLFLVTEIETFNIMKKPKYRALLQGVSVVLLTTGEEFTA